MCIRDRYMGMTAKTHSDTLCSHCGRRGHRTAECRHKEVECYNCGKLGHVARDCRAGCYVCGKVGHFARECRFAANWDYRGYRGNYKNAKSRYSQKSTYRGQSNYQTYNRRKNPITCYSCGRQGHTASYCQAKPYYTETPYDRACYSCGKRGHLAKECYGGESGRCYSCGKLGHFTRDCPRR
eukprot:TRINITY_DN5262_c0_g4_i2.p2 TRINITY_DN5262_c0_g4~~TRINITY_DN5262_c0_g4_i2.p2  ORF type:complete len:182 (-),score=13.13 TRINITY_DN5262_c0_g4_i2:94-639(-)